MTEMTKEERTTALGVYNFAQSYRAAADHLHKADLHTTHPHTPINFLYYHAIELYLKSFLRVHNFGVDELRGIGHKADRLAKEAEARGFHFDDEDRDVIRMIAESDVVIRSRYIETGYFVAPTLEALARTTKSFQETVRDALKAAGEPVRD